MGSPSLHGYFLSLISPLSLPSLFFPISLISPSLLYLHLSHSIMFLLSFSTISLTHYFISISPSISLHLPVSLTLTLHFVACRKCAHASNFPACISREHVPYVAIWPPEIGLYGGNYVLARVLQAIDADLMRFDLRNRDIFSAVCPLALGFIATRVRLLRIIKCRLPCCFCSNETHIPIWRLHMTVISFPYHGLTHMEHWKGLLEFMFIDKWTFCDW